MVYFGCFVVENEGVNGVCKVLFGEDDIILGVYVLGNFVFEIIMLVGMVVEMKLKVVEWKKIVFLYFMVVEIFCEVL